MDIRRSVITIGSLRKYLSKHIYDSDDKIVLSIVEPVFGSKDTSIDVFNDGFNMFDISELIKEEK